MEQFPQNPIEEPVESVDVSVEEPAPELNKPVTGFKKIAKAARIVGALGFGYLGMGAPEAEAKVHPEDRLQHKMEHMNDFRLSDIKSFKLPKFRLTKEVSVPQNPGVKLEFALGTPQSVIDAEIAKIAPESEETRTSRINGEKITFHWVLEKGKRVPAGAMKSREPGRAELYTVNIGGEAFYYAFDKRLKERLRFPALGETEARQIADTFFEKREKGEQ